MTKTSTLIAAAFAAFIGGGPALADKIDIRVDLSTSMKITEDDSFAAAAAKEVARKIEALSLGDRVGLRFFGAYGHSNNLKKLDLAINRRQRAPEVAGAVKKIVAAIPRLIRDGKLEIQGATNIIATLEEKGYDCRDEPVEIVLITDGLEASPFVSPVDLATGKAPLPPAEGPVLAGCTLTMIGLGATRHASRQMTRTLTEAWKGWAEDAGATGFNAVTLQ